MYPQSTRYRTTLKQLSQTLERLSKVEHYRILNKLFSRIQAMIHADHAQILNEEKKLNGHVQTSLLNISVLPEGTVRTEA